jgi:HSP20 family protein
MGKKQNKKEKLDVDFEIGKLGLGGILKGVEKLVGLASRLEETGGEIRKEGEFDLSQIKGGMKGVFGFSVKTAVGGKPVVERFGNIKQTPNGPTVEEVREPLTDVFEEEREIRIYIEMPGVEEKNIAVDLKDDILDISVETGERKYHKEVLLPAQVKPETLKTSYKNGLFEAVIEK